MRKVLTFVLAFCSIMLASAANDGSSCAQAVDLQYGADIRLDGSTYWIRFKVEEFDKNGLSAFWYSNDSLYLEGFFASGGMGGTPVTCTPINLSIMTAANAKIFIEPGELMARLEAQMSKQGGLDEEEKNLIRSSKVYLSLEPRSKQPGRFIMNEFGLAVGSDCDNPWDVALGAVYGLTENQNVFRLDPIELDSLHVSYEPMKSDDENYTLMNVDVRLGSCTGPVAQSGKSVAGVEEGLFIPRKSLLDSAVMLKQPLYFVINRGDQPATVAFRRVKTDNGTTKRTVCPNEPIKLGNLTVSEPGVYEYETKIVDGEYAIYRHMVATVEKGENCEDALENIYDESVLVRPTAVQAGELVEVVAEGNNNLDVYDLAGRRMMSMPFVDATSLRLAVSGEYIVRISGNKMQTRRVVVY